MPPRLHAGLSDAAWDLVLRTWRKQPCTKSLWLLTSLLSWQNLDQNRKRLLSVAHRLFSLEESIPEISRLTVAKNKNQWRDRHGLFVILYKWLVRLLRVTLSAPAGMLRTVRTRCNSSVMAFATSIQLTVKSLLVFMLCCCRALAANYSHLGHSHTLTCYQSTLLLARLFQNPVRTAWCNPTPLFSTSLCLSPCPSCR